MLRRDLYSNGMAGTMKFVPKLINDGTMVIYPKGFYYVMSIQSGTGYVSGLSAVETESLSWRAEGVLISAYGDLLTLADSCVFYNIVGTSVTSVSYADIRSKLSGEKCYAFSFDAYGYVTGIYILNLK